MRARLLLLLAVAVSIPLSASQAQVQRWCGDHYGAQDGGHTIESLRQGKPKTYLVTPCHDAECQAAKDIVCAITGLERDRFPNSLAYVSPRAAAQAWAIYKGNIAALGREHPGRTPLYCKLLAGVATTITGNEGPNDWTASDVTSLALQLDRPGNHCLANVVAAVPEAAADEPSIA